MGMTLGLYAISGPHVEAIRANPGLAWKVLAFDDPEWAGEMMEEAGVPEDAAAGFEPDENEVKELSLDKAWHGIHYLLTGSDWEGEAPFDFLLQGGELLFEENEDTDASPRLFHSEEVQEIDRALATLDEETLRRRFDPESMQRLQIYPDVWDRGEEELDWCLIFFRQLKPFIADTARRQCGMLIFMG